MVPCGACFHFIGLFCYKALTAKVEKTCKKTLFRGSSYKMTKVKNYFVVNIYFIYRYSKIKKKQGNVVFLKLEAFNCNVSFYGLTLTTVIVILRLKFEVKCYCKKLI